MYSGDLEGIAMFFDGRSLLMAEIAATQSEIDTHLHAGIAALLVGTEFKAGSPAFTRTDAYQANRIKRGLVRMEAACWS